MNGHVGAFGHINMSKGLPDSCCELRIPVSHTPNFGGEGPVFMDCTTAEKCLNKLVYVSDDLADLYANDRRNSNKFKLLCLRTRLIDSELTHFMSQADWPLHLTAQLQLPLGDHWLIATESSGDKRMNATDRQLLEAAAGATDTPSGNVRCTWPIRRYDERESSNGSVEWLAQMLKANRDAQGVVRPLLTYLSQLLQSARDNGAAFFIEQISLIIAKDPNADNSCLTPRLHADEYYGQRETAILSLLEPGWSEKGGTWFLPADDMNVYPDGDYIRPEDLSGDHFRDTPIVYSSHGELCLYDGMKNKSGNVCQHLGLPHISGDLTGQSSRLVVLLNHEPPQ